MNTDGSSVVATLVAAQQEVLADAGREERRRVNGVLLLLRARRNESALAQYRLRRAATGDNVVQVAAAMRAHLTARSMYEVLCDMHLGQLYGFAVQKADLDHLLGQTENQFDEAERLSSQLGVNGKDALSLPFAASEKASH
ncbi:hypothetical protein [Ottowia sp.]|uniref:hypothetical protein n=1 Tax=Ottowia sp. TaxID=1898956 RepID=UPI0025F98154|nr:hypothetical protein [Ottowia sp.]MBK6616511.1 hypothetical protein [Ottowia sp.]